MRTPAGEPEERGAGSPTPCDSCPKVPRYARNSLDWQGCRAKADELNDANRAAWDYWYQYRDRPPDDELFAWYAGIIRRVMDELDYDQTAAQYQATGAAVEAMVTLALIRRR